MYKLNIQTMSQFQKYFAIMKKVRFSQKYHKIYYVCHILRMPHDLTYGNHQFNHFTRTVLSVRNLKTVLKDPLHS